jgi:hypothetical protein
MRGDIIISVIDGRRYMTYKIHNNIYNTTMKWYLYDTHKYKAYFITYAREKPYTHENSETREVRWLMMVSEAHVFHIHTTGAPPVFVILYIINMATPKT